MSISKMNLGGSSEQTIKTYEQLSEAEQPLWLEYSKKIADLGYFPGFLSPNCVPLSEDPNLVLSIYSKPLKFFGNLQFILETVDGYRVYNDTAEWNGVSDGVKLWFDKSDTLVAIDSGDPSITFTAASDQISLSKNDRSSLLRHFYWEEIETIKPLIWRAGRKFESFPDLFIGNVDATGGRYVSDVRDLCSIRDMPKFTDAFEIEHDVLRGGYNKSLGEVVKVFGKDVVLSRYLDITQPGFDILFLKFKEEDEEKLAPVIMEPQLYRVVDGFKYVVYPLVWGDELDSVFNCSYTAKAFSTRFLDYNILDEVDLGRRKSVDKLYKRLCDLGVTVRKHGYHEYELEIK